MSGANKDKSNSNIEPLHQPTSWLFFFDFLANYVQSSQSQHGLLVCNPDLIANCPHLGSPPELRREIALQEETIFFLFVGY